MVRLQLLTLRIPSPVNSPLKLVVIFKSSLGAPEEALSTLAKILWGNGVVIPSMPKEILRLLLFLHIVSAKGEIGPNTANTSSAFSSTSDMIAPQIHGKPSWSISRKILSLTALNHEVLLLWDAKQWHIP